MEEVKPEVMENCDFENRDESKLVSFLGISRISIFRQKDQDPSFFY